MLRRLSLTNYRNHSRFDLELSEITVLVGKNGAGKTNILESIELLSSCRSFRGDNRLDLIRLDTDYTRVVGDDLEVFIQRSPRLSFQVKERGIKRRVADFVGLLPSVIFTPETLQIITDEPKERRRFLDIVISQKDHQYLRALQDYKKVLTQRNNLLKLISEGRSNKGELDFWDQELVVAAKIITEGRKEATKSFSGQVSQFYQTISGQKKSSVEIIYHAKAEGDFAARLVAKRGIDIAAGLTTSGPHRDDLQFKLNTLEAEKYASRGELRSIVLALKMAELKYLENGGALVGNTSNKLAPESAVAKNTGQTETRTQSSILAKVDDTRPILLLDDIFSEFDADHRSHLYKLIANYQSVITTTDRNHLSPELLTKSKVIEIK